MKRHLLVIPVITIFLCASGPAWAGAPPLEWQTTFGGLGNDDGFFVQQTSDGGFIVVGDTWTGGSGAGATLQDILLTKTDAAGVLEWSKTYGGPYLDLGSCVRETTDGGFIIAGRTSIGSGSLANVNAYLVKTDRLGNRVWSRSYGGPRYDEAVAVRQTSDGGYIFVGSTESYGPAMPSKRNIYLVRTDPNGNQLWVAYYGRGDVSETGSAVLQTADGGYLVCGCWPELKNPGGTALRYYPSGYILKIDGTGHQLWSRTYSGGSSDVLVSAEQTADGGFILGGYTDSSGAGGADFYLVRTDGAGGIIWNGVYGGADDEFGAAVASASDGGFIIGGSRWSAGDLNDRRAYLVKTGADGSKIWESLIDNILPPETASFVEAYSLQGTADEGCVLAGVARAVHTEAGNPVVGFDVYLAKVAPEQTVIEIGIDVKPGSEDNPINLRAKGVLPVAVISDERFVAADLDPLTVFFAGAAVARRPNGTPMASLEDVDADGDLDYILHFRITDLSLTPGLVTVVLTGQAYDGRMVEGRDTVRVFARIGKVKR